MARARILLADDHPEMRKMVSRLLEREFDIVEQVADGRAFLDAAARLRPDLCILDITMPVINGIEAALQLKNQACTSKILILTLHEDADFVEAAFAAGASGYVVKSKIMTDLRLGVREVLAGRTFISSVVH